MSRNRTARKADAGSAKRGRKNKPAGRRTWKAMDRAATVVAGLVARRATAALWRTATGKKPPAASEHPELSRVEAVGWAVFAGAGVELSKVLIHRATAAYWVKSTGKLPPGMTSLRGADGADDAAAGKQKPAESPAEGPAGGRRVRSRSRDR